ncbi:MAG: hypothetical protein ACD_47C00260G0001 [uncultured bacterium]|nr:MAG: hypothetical protein ACD_47C00260G0001 [uncultured bacterium]
MNGRHITDLIIPLTMLSDIPMKRSSSMGSSTIMTSLLFMACFATSIEGELSANSFDDISETSGMIEPIVGSFTTMKPRLVSIIFIATLKMNLDAFL